jgi:hypothetical protein
MSYDPLMRAVGLVVLVGCNGDALRLTASTTFTISDSTGQGPSHLDILIGQTVSMMVDFDSPDQALVDVAGCPANEWTQSKAPTRASGTSAAMVKTEILDYLPDWRVRLSLCEIASQSSLQLSADNFMNTGFTIGCIGLPAAAMQSDDTGNPVWSSFTTAPLCTFSILDADTNRVLGARDFAVAIAR